MVANGASSSQVYASWVAQDHVDAGSSSRVGAAASASSVVGADGPPANTDVSMPLENARPSPMTTSARMSPGSSSSDAPSSAHLAPHLERERVQLVGAVERSQPTRPSRSKRRVSRWRRAVAVSSIRAGDRPARAPAPEPVDRIDGRAPSTRTTSTGCDEAGAPRVRPCRTAAGRRTGRQPPSGLVASISPDRRRQRAAPRGSRHRRCSRRPRRGSRGRWPGPARSGSATGRLDPTL